MKKALLSAVLSAAIAGAAAAPAFADDARRERVVTSGKAGNAAHRTPRAKNVRRSPPPVQGNAIQEDAYTAAREQMIRSAM